ncbi:MAG: glycoside hydrolase family 5 protein [Lachnospiraceae bacterium]|nr:glycoside hydrolase family 5 protein [Lachnospiraceae bacterium]
MRKRLLGLFTVICMLFAAICPDSQVSAAAKKKTGKLSKEVITVDEEIIPCTRYSISGKNYYSLGDLAYLLTGTGSQFSFSGSKSDSSVTVKTSTAYVPSGNEMQYMDYSSVSAKKADSVFIIDGTKHTDFTVYNINGDSFVDPYELRYYLNFSVDYNPDTDSDSITTKYENNTNDYKRAFKKGYVAKKWKSVKKSKKITSAEYKALLSNLIKKKAPGQLDFFNKKVSDYNTKLTRIQAITMTWYAAICLDAAASNCLFRAASVNDLWLWDAATHQKLFPGCFSTTAPGREWDEATESAIWHASFISPVSGQHIVSYDYGTGSFLNASAFTAADAVRAITRLNDAISYKGKNPATEITGWLDRTRNVSSDSKLATTPNSAYLTKDIIEQANATSVKSFGELKRLTGFTLASGNGFGYNSYTIEATPKDVKNIADWGFSSVRILMTYDTLFSRDGSKVDIVRMSQLDALIAEAITDGLHVNLLFSTLPGRWHDFDYNTYTEVGELDMFVNNKKVKQAELVWKTMAERYKDIPGAYLSFQLFWEPLNWSLSSGLPAPDYDENDVYRVLDTLIGDIRAIDPDRFIMYETTGLLAEHVINTFDTFKLNIEKKYDNLRITHNYVDAPFVFYFMGTSEENINIDNQSHSLFIPEYPMTVYAAQKHLEGENAMSISGCLPKGTTLELYISKTDGTGDFTVTDGRNTLYSESIGCEEFETSYTLSSTFPFATSEKKITVKLKESVQKLIFSCPEGYVESSGINVILPESYAVERRYAYSSWDAFNDGVGMEEGGVILKKTSTVMICPNSFDTGHEIVINKDVTYTSEAIFTKSNSSIADKFGSEISEFSPECLIRFEVVGDADYESMLRYYNDVLSVFDKYGFDWYSACDYYYITGKDPSAEKLYGDHMVSYGGYEHFDLERLKLFQKHQ